MRPGAAPCDRELGRGGSGGDPGVLWGGNPVGDPGVLWGVEVRGPRGGRRGSDGSDAFHQKSVLQLRPTAHAGAISLRRVLDMQGTSGAGDDHE